MGYGQELMLIKINPEKHLGRLDNLRRKYSNDPEVLRQIDDCIELIYREEESVDVKWKKLQKALLEYKKADMRLEEILKYGEWDRKLEGIDGFDSL
jgi:hypothetical protein